MRKIHLLIILGILICNNVVAQTIQYGFVLSLGVNDIAPNRKTISTYAAAYENLLAHRNNTANIGGILKYNGSFLELNFNLFTFDNSILEHDKLIINDTYNGSKYLILNSVNTTKEVGEDKTIAYTGDYGFNSILGTEIFNFNKYSINLVAGIGVQYLNDRSATAVIKEESSNTYFNATYNFRTNRLLTYSPRLEFVYHPTYKSSSFSIYLYSGVHFQNTKYTTSRSLENSSGIIIYNDKSTFSNSSSTITAGIGLRFIAP